MIKQLKSLLVPAIALVISGAVFSACEKKEQINEVYFTENCKVYRPTDQLTDTLRGEQIIEEAFGAGKITSADTILCMVTRDNEAMFALYNTRGDSLASIGVRGQGPNDFTVGWTSGQRFDNGDDVGIWINDVNVGHLKGLNLSKSLREGKSIVDTTLMTDAMVTNAVVNDGKIIDIVASGNNCALSVISAADQTQIHREQLFLMDLTPMFTAFYCDMVISPDGRYLVLAMRALNEVNIIDLNDYSRLTATVGNVPVKDAVADGKVYERSPTLSDRYIMTLCDNGADQSDTEKRPGSLHIFDYQGNLIANVPLDRYLYSITYVAKDNCIYALDDNESVYRYPLDAIGLKR